MGEAGSPFFGVTGTPLRLGITAVPLYQLLEIMAWGGGKLRGCPPLSPHHPCVEGQGDAGGGVGGWDRVCGCPAPPPPKAFCAAGEG